MKKFTLIALSLTCVCQLTRARTNTIPTTDLDINNPYTASIIAGILPKNEVKEKTKLLEGIVKHVKSLSPDLGLLESYYASGQLKKVVNLINKTPDLKELIIEHPRTGLVVVKTFIRLGMNETAMRYLIKLNEKHPTDREVTFLIAQFYERKKELKNALKVIDNYLNKAIKKHANFAFLFLKSRLYTKLDDHKNALASIEEALKLQPKFDLGWFMFAQMKEKKGELKAAIKGYTNYLDTASSSPKNLAGRILFKAIETKLFKLLFDQIIKKYPNHGRNQLDRCRNRIINLFKQKKYKDALQELDSCLSKQGCNEKTKLMKIQVQCSHNLFVALYFANMLTRNAQIQQAINYYYKALALTDKPELKTSIYFQLGLLYYKIKAFDKMQTALEKGRALGLNYAPILNLLAYYYTTKGNNLTEAQRLMHIVLKNEPGNPHFLDTQALILYKQGKYTQALALLEEIVKKEPDDVTIVKHLARTYQKLGQLEQGVAYLKHVVKLTYDKNKKQKYQQVLNVWKAKAHGKKSGQLLCCR